MEDLPICSDPVAMEKAFHGEFSPRSWEVLGWQHFCSDKFEMGGGKIHPQGSGTVETYSGECAAVFLCDVFTGVRGAL